MCLGKFVELSKKGLAVGNDVVPLMSINVDTLLVANWLKAEVMQPTNGGPQAYGAWKMGGANAQRGGGHR